MLGQDDPMTARTAVALMLGAAAVLSACGTGRSPTATPGSTFSAPTAVPTSSITCVSSQPRDDFEYSTDQDELEAFAKLIGDELVLPGTFDDVDANELGVLMEHGFVDPRGDTNGSPTMWEFHQFLCDHPSVRAIGFIAGGPPEDDEAVASIETVYADTIDDALRADAREFCKTTPEKTLTGHLECFWD